MSFCIISDHIYNYAKTQFHYNPQHIDQVKPKSEGGLQPPKPTPKIRPCTITIHYLKVYHFPT